MNRPRVKRDRERRERDEGWARDVEEQRREDREMKRQVDALLASLDPNDRTAVVVGQVFEMFQAWYFTFSKRSADRVRLINATIRRLIRVTLTALAVTAVVLAVVGVLSIRITIEQGHQRQQFSMSVQTSRYDASYSACSSSNQRNRAATADIVKLFAAPVPAGQPRLKPEQRAQQLAGVDKLASDIVPYHADCRAYANHQTRLPATGSRPVSGQTTVTTTKTAAAAPMPSCVGSNYHMQCAVNAPQTPPTQPPAKKFGAPPAAFGIDTYGAGNSGYPGASFDCSYLSGSPGGKDWTRAGINAWTARGRKVCFVWETYATRAEYGYAAGQQDAIRARNEMAELGMPTYVPIRFAVDTDTSANDVAAYFEGAKSVLGSRTGAYGSYFVVSGLEARGITTCRNDWETVAWSAGNRGCASLYQASIEHNTAYGNVDFDYTNAADYGQYPYAQKPPNVRHYERFDKTRRTFRNQRGHVVATASEVNTVRTWDQRGCVNPVKRPVCKSSRYHLILLRDRDIAVAHTNGHGQHVKTADWRKGKPWNLGDRNQQLWHREQGRHVFKSWAAAL